MSRGLRNRNPGNIRLSSTRFKGEVDSSDKAFKQFRSEAWGYRAIFVILRTYNKKYGINTIRGIIERWAPPIENQTQIYIESVSRRSMLDADTPLDPTQRVAMLPLVAAISYVENGVAAQWKSLEQGWELFEADLEVAVT